MSLKISHKVNTKSEPTQSNVVSYFYLQFTVQKRRQDFARRQQADGELITFRKWVQGSG